MNPRLAAARALAAVSAGKASLGSSLPPQLRNVAARDQALTQELAFGTARWWPRLEILANSLLDKPLKPAEVELQALLLVGLYQLLYMRIPAHAAISETVSAANALKKPWARGMLNAVLRRAQREAEVLLPTLERDPVIVTAHPRWMQKRLKADWPEQWLDICAANNLHPPMTLRVNARHGTREAYLARLKEAGITAHPAPYSPSGVTLEEPCDVQLLPGFAEGHVSVQDEAAQLAAPLLESSAGQRVLDACCAPGGKTGHILEQGDDLDELVALDAEPLRLERVRENLQRLRLVASLVSADGRDLEKWWDGKPFDRILLDAPCSATGVIRRHPDIKLTRQPDDIDRLAALQGELLDQLWQTLAVGGIRVYATCSILPQENSEVIQRFLEREPGARALPIAAAFGIAQPCGRQLLPQPGGHDGFYLAKLIKIAASGRHDGYTAANKETSIS